MNRRAGPGAVAKRIVVVDERVLATLAAHRQGLEDLVVAHRDLDAAARLDRVDLGAKDVTAEVLEKPGVAALLHGVLVDRPGALLVDQLALDLAAADLHREAAHGGSLRHGEDVLRLEAALRVVDEDLHDRGRGALSVDDHLDVVPLEGERRQIGLHGYDETGGAQGSGAEKKQDGGRKKERKGVSR